MMAPMVRLLRPHQYTKNLLVFAAPGAAGSLSEDSVAWRAILAFALFSMLSSAGYVANDLGDVDADRQHPRKQHRPIASGAVSVSRARVMLVALLVVAATVTPVLGFRFALTAFTYAVVTFSYTAVFKRVPWFELLVVSAGFLLRAMAGGAATLTSLSPWFFGVVSAGALMVITGKRLGELLSQGQNTASRPVLKAYTQSSLRALSTVAAILAVAAYATWALSDASNRTGDESGDLILKLTIVPFMAAISRYLRLSWRGKGEAPDIVVFRDPFMLVAGLAWVAMYVVGLYI